MSWKKPGVSGPFVCANPRHETLGQYGTQLNRTFQTGKKPHFVACLGSPD